MSALVVVLVALCLSLLSAAAPSSNGLKIFVYDLPQWRHATEWGDIRCASSCTVTLCKCLHLSCSNAAALPCAWRMHAWHRPCMCML
jgi:hypothetical protein